MIDEYLESSESLITANSFIERKKTSADVDKVTGSCDRYKRVEQELLIQHLKIYLISTTGYQLLAHLSSFIEAYDRLFK
jgi:hypothetical protein